MDRLRVALLIGCVAAGPVFAGVVAAPARAATATVSSRGSEFVPKQVDVNVGDTVVWVYESGTWNESHTVTFDNGPDLNPNCGGLLISTGCLDRANPRVQRTFTGVGTFPYYCKIHGGPGGQGMSGVVIVTAATTTTAATTSSTLPRATTTSSTARASTSSTTGTTRPLATSSTFASSTTSTTSDTSSVLLPGDPPPFSGEDANSAAGQSGGSDDGSDSGTVALIVGLLLAVSVGGGYLLWRLRPGRA